MSWRVAVEQLAEDMGQQQSGTCVVLPRTAELVCPWQERANLWAAGRKKERVSAGMREPGLVFVGFDHPVTTFVMPGKGFNEVGSLFFISSLFPVYAAICTVPISSGGLVSSSVDTCNFSHLDVYVQ